MEKKEPLSQKLKSFLPYFILAVAIICAYKIINEISFLENAAAQFWGAIAPFLYGFVLAYFVNLPSGAIKRRLLKSKFRVLREKSKGIGILCGYVILGFLVFLILRLLIPIIVDGVQLFVSNFPRYYADLMEFINYLNSLETVDINIDLNSIAASFQTMVQDAVKGISSEDFLSSVQAIFGVSSVIFDGFVTLISSIYILIEKDRFKKYLHKLIGALASPAVYSTTRKYVARLNANFKRYIYTQTIDGLIIATLVSIELTILGSPYALNIGIALGIVNYIPYFGSIIGCIVAIIIVAFTQGLPAAGIAAAMLIATQQIDGNIIQPKLMGTSFSLSPLLVLFSVILGGALGGVLGMIIAIPILAVLKDLLDSFITYYKQKKTEVRLSDTP